MWIHEHILTTVSAGLQEREAELRQEQAVHGLDALDELALHPIISTALSREPLGVLKEQPYPSEWAGKFGSAKPSGPECVDHATGEVLSVPLPERRDRHRCDIVLTPEPGQRLIDGLVVAKSRRVQQVSAMGGLFEAHARQEQPALIVDQRAIEPESAYWLEVKQVAQFDLSSGVPGFSRTYASKLVKLVAMDLAKLHADERIMIGGVLLVLFTADLAVVQHDVPAMMHKLLDRQLPVGSPAMLGFDITDRLGNGRCTLALFGYRRT